MKTRILFILIVTIFSSNYLIAQSNTSKIEITGYITDTNKKPLQEVVLLVDDVKVDVYINRKGRYKIKIPSNTQKIVAFSIKNGLKEHLYNGETEVNFVLQTEQFADKIYQNDDNQVDVGYGTMNKKDLTTSVGSVNIDENNTYQNIYEMIAGKVSGVMVSGTSITIRGKSSFNLSTEPLFVVDGVITNSIENIIPNDVDNISILKGSESAIYGSRGANGVILINLKKAKKN